MSVLWGWIVTVFAPLTWLIRTLWRPVVWLALGVLALVMVGVVAFGLYTTIAWGWGLAAGMGSKGSIVAVEETPTMPTPEIEIIVPTMTPIPAWTETPEATSEPTATVKAVAAKAKPAKAQPQAVVAQPAVQPTVQPTVAVMVPIREGSPSQKCGYSLPADWVSIPDGAWMTGNGIQATKQFTVPSGKVAYVWGTDVDGLGRVLLVQKGPWSGTRTIFDGAYRIGSLTSSSIESATAHMQAFLQCEYAGVWGVPQYAPPNQ